MRPPLRPATLALGALLIGIAAAGCSSSTSSAPTTTAAPSGNFESLIGKRLPAGELPADNPRKFLSIASPYSHPSNIDGTRYPPLISNNASGQWIAFFDFSTSKAASFFLENLPTNARLINQRILEFDPLKGTTGLYAPSRLYDERGCLWAGGAGQGGSGVGTPSGGTLLANETCTSGTPSSIGVATAFQQGTSVVVVSDQNSSSTVIGGSGNPSSAAQNVSLSEIGENLLNSAGIT